MKYPLAPFLLLTLAGCGLLENADTPEIRLEADRLAYQPGQEVVLSLINLSERTFTVSGDLCDAVLLQQQQTTWQPLSGEGVCPDVGVVLKQGGAIVSRKRLAETLSAGRYRYGYELKDGGGSERYRHFERIEVYTRVFEVSE